MSPTQDYSGFPQRPRPIKPQTGQESVWDYPRPPRVEPRSERIVVRLGGQVIADTTDAVRVLETSHPPVYYLPLDSFPAGVLVPVQGTSFCEFKGEAHYFDVVAGGIVASRAALYPGRMESCGVGGEQVNFQAGDFYGGWITRQIVGPFKGGPGTAGW